MYIFCMKNRINNKRYQNKPRIVRELSKRGDEILKMTVKDVVKEYGSGGHVILPKNLVGKYVIIIYNPGVEEDGKSNNRT